MMKKSGGTPPKRYFAKKLAQTPVKDFTKLVLGSLSVSLGDAVIVNEEADSNTFGVIVQIRGNRMSKDASFVKVRWLYKPTELFVTVPAAVGADELFDSDHFQDVNVQTISGKIQLLSFEEYFNREAVESDMYYCRATYCTTTKKLKPSIDQWRRVCWCKTPISPDLKYRECGECYELFHLRCLGEDEEEVQDWRCPECSAGSK